MSARILDGRKLARDIRTGLAEESAQLERNGTRPGLAVVLVGDDPASRVYVGKKEEAAHEAGIRSRVVRLPVSATREEVLETVRALGDDPEIHGLLVQLPLPDHLDAAEIQRAVPAHKDVDGLHPQNAGNLLLGHGDGLIPCTPLGIMALIDAASVDVAGLHAVVVGRSAIVGKPVALLLLARHATVTLCHSRTARLDAVCRGADVLVAAVGIPGLIGAEHIKEGAIVIDVGVNDIRDPVLAEKLLASRPKRLEAFRRRGHALVGDVDFAAASARAGALTPVPGGVGPLTVAMLIKNTISAARLAAASAQQVESGRA